MENLANESYMLCIMDSDKQKIYGSYTERRFLIQAYDSLMLDEKNVLIYRFQVNEFPPKELKALEEYRIDLGKVRSNVKVAEFYGCEVFCDLDFKAGAFFNFKYDDDRNVYYERVNIETDVMEGDFNRYLLPVLKSWYKENKAVLLKIWKNKRLEEIPNWEE